MKLPRPHRYLLILGVLLAAGFATPAADAPAARDAACAPAASGSAARVASIRDARGVVREPELNDTAEEVPDSAKGKGGPGFRATVPIWFHVITDGATGAVSDETIAAQMAAQNAGFAGSYGGANTGFKFKLAGVNRTNNAEWFNAAAGSKAERDMKKALRVGGADTLNVYTTSGAGFLGWAYYPSTYKTRPYLDGIVIDYRSMPGGPTARSSRSASRSRMRPGTGSGCTTRSRAVVTPRATTSMTRRLSGRRRPAAPRARTLAQSRAWTRFTTTWITHSTPATPSSPRVSAPGCRTSTCSSGPRSKASRA